MTRKSIKNWISEAWYRDHPALLPARPLGAAVSVIARQRQKQRRHTDEKAPYTVLVVGNITVGGSGKTPLVIELARYFKERGIRVGVVSRGYGGHLARYPHSVEINDRADEVGDEPLLIRRRAQVPVVVDPDRLRACDTLHQRFQVSLIISDDGMQHYNMPRDYEIAVIDGSRWLGNERCIPAGPLREPLERLQTVDAIVINGQSDYDPERYSSVPVHEMQLESDEQLLSVHNHLPRDLNEFLQEHPRVHAVAGIGHPHRFFQNLQDLGFEVIPHVFSDHHLYAEQELLFNDELPVLMTEKDAVKCHEFAHQHWFYLPVRAALGEAFYAALEAWCEEYKARLG